MKVFHNYLIFFPSKRKTNIFAFMKQKKNLAVVQFVYFINLTNSINK